MNTGYHIDTTMILFAGLLALVWGIVWALFLQHTKLGQFLAVRRTWISVVVGVGVDLLILVLLLPLDLWLMVTVIVALSSVGIIGRSLWNELRETEDVLNGLKDKST